MRVPIACSLSVDDVPTRLDEWRTALSRSITAVRRPSPTELLLVLRGDRAGLDELVELTQRELACCAFFGFTLDIGVDAVSLRVTVPPDAAAVLDDFAGLLA